MVVKQNQPNLYEAIALLFQTPPVPAPPGEVLSYAYHGKAHGRLEQRTLESSTALNHYLDWPGIAQVLRRTCRRVMLRTGIVESETTYGITSLPRPLAGPEQLERFGAATGPLKTSCTTCAMRPWAKTVVRSILAMHRRLWRPSAMPSCRFYDSTVGAILLRQRVATPTSRSVFCDSSEFLHYEITLLKLRRALAPIACNRLWQSQWSERAGQQSNKDQHFSLRNLWSSSTSSQITPGSSWHPAMALQDDEPSSRLSSSAAAPVPL